MKIKEALNEMEPPADKKTKQKIKEALHGMEIMMGMSSSSDES